MRTHLLTSGSLLFATLTLSGIASAQSVANYNYNSNARVFAADSGTFGTRPSGGADGNTDPNFSSAFYHNGSGDAAGRRWWYVDLGSDFQVTGLSFYFRGDCCEFQNDGDLLELWTSTPTFADGAPSTLFSTTLLYSGNPTQDVNFSGSGITARYVSVWAPSTSDYDTIAFPELEVTATPEPASMGLVATGLMAVGALARRRRRSVKR